MKFHQDFQKDIEEAYEYWCSKQTAAGSTPSIGNVTHWAASILGQAIYVLLAEKRTAAHPEEVPDAPQEG